MDPNYYESILKHLTPKFMIDDRMEIESEILEQFNNKFGNLFKKINSKLKEIKEIKNIKGNFHHGFEINSGTEKHSKIQIEVLGGNKFKNPLNYYGESLRDKGKSIIVELIFKNEEYAKQFAKEAKEKIEPLFDEFPYFKTIKAYNGEIKTSQKNNKVCLEIFIPIKILDDTGEILNLLLMEKFGFGLEVKIGLNNSINLRKIQDISKDDFLQNLLNSGFYFDINYENYYEIFSTFLDCYSRDEDDSDLGPILQKICSCSLAISLFNFDYKLNIEHNKLIDFLVDLGVDKTPTDYWMNIIYEEAKDLKILFVDVLNNILEHLNLSLNLDYITGGSLSRICHKGKVAVIINISE